MLKAGHVVQFVFPTSGLYVPAAHWAVGKPSVRTSLSTSTWFPVPITDKYLPSMALEHVMLFETAVDSVLF